MKQVNFEQLVEFQKEILPNLKKTYPILESQLLNLKLFMEMMGKSSSFAHKAHKELRKLSKKLKNPNLYDIEYWHWNNGKWIYSHPTNDENIIISQFATNEARDSAGQVIIDAEVVVTGLELGLDINKGSKILDAGIEWLSTRLNHEDQIDIFDSETDAQVVLHDTGYTFRNLPVHVGITCCITGESNHRGARESGILEWCTNGDDAASMLNKMKKYTQFSNLKIEILDLDDTKSN